MKLVIERLHLPNYVRLFILLLFLLLFRRFGRFLFPLLRRGENDRLFVTERARRRNVHRPAGFDFDGFSSEREDGRLETQSLRRCPERVQD
jgi:hypothetical protein